MARNIRDGLPWSANLELWDPVIPDFKEDSHPRLPTWIPPPNRGAPNVFGIPPQQSSPKLPDFKIWDWLIRGMPEIETSPDWSRHQQPLPQPGPSPFPDPAPLLRQTPPAHEVDPPKHRGSVITEIRSEPAGGGLLGLLEKAMRQGERRTDDGLESGPRAAPAQIVLMQPARPVRRLVRM